MVCFIRRSVNIVKVGKESSFNGVVLPVGRLKMIGVRRREDSCYKKRCSSILEMFLRLEIRR